MKLEYVVDQAVGQGGANFRNDVLLVQYFLYVAMEYGDTSPGYNPPGEQPIAIDGACGRQTIAYIKYFQEEGNRRNPGSPTVVDGRVDPIANGTIVGPLSGRFYTILALNAAFRERRGVAAHDDLGGNGDFPQELFKCFYLL